VTLAYQALETRFKRMSAISGALSMLGWDRSVMMPPGSGEARAEQMAVLSVMLHELKIAPDMATLLEEAKEDDSLTGWQQANVREMHHSWKHATAEPSELVEKLSRARARAEMIWRTARKEDDFKALISPLGDLLALVRESAGAKADALGVAPYDALLDGFDPGRTMVQVDETFDDLMGFLPDFIDDAHARQAAQPDVLKLDGSFDVTAQEHFGRQIMETLGFDFSFGRLDTSEHPFSGGVPDDSRITTRYDTEDFTPGLMGLIHETGHSNYERGLPKDWRGQPVGRSRGMTLHESQSLLYEMQAARSPQFVSYLAPRLVRAFSGNGKAWEAENLTRNYHHIERSLIRVHADEATYPLHVILRYRLERAMISGDLEIKDLPGAWNEAMAELVGVTPQNDRDGCMQDIHWPSGAFGYFPTYTLGALAAAQIFASARKALPGLMEQIEEGDFGPLNGWLGENVHALGCRYSPDETIAYATGGPLATHAFKAHLKERYLPE
jgi:carboxypeptidase Taq